MAHYALYQQLSISREWDSARIAAQIDAALQAGNVPYGHSVEEVRIARAVLGDERTRALYDARLQDPNSPEITLSSLKDLAISSVDQTQGGGKKSAAGAAGGAGSSSGVRQNVDGVSAGGATSWAGFQQSSSFQAGYGGRGMQGYQVGGAQVLGQAPQYSQQADGYQQQYPSQYSQQYAAGRQQQSEWKQYQNQDTGQFSGYQQQAIQQHYQGEGLEQYSTYQKGASAYSPVPSASNSVSPRDFHEMPWMDPSYAYAPTVARVAAGILDWIIVVAPLMIIAGLTIFASAGGLVRASETLFFYLLVFGLPVLYKVLCEAMMGQTLGKR